MHMISQLEITTNEMKIPVISLKGRWSGTGRGGPGMLCAWRFWARLGGVLRSLTWCVATSPWQMGGFRVSSNSNHSMIIKTKSSVQFLVLKWEEKLKKNKNRCYLQEMLNFNLNLLKWLNNHFKWQFIVVFFVCFCFFVNTCFTLWSKIIFN